MDANWTDLRPSRCATAWPSETASEQVRHRASCFAPPPATPGRLWTGTALIAVHQACETFVPILIGIIIDRAVTPGDLGQLLLWVAVLAALFTLLTMAYRFGARQLMNAIAEEAHQLRLEVSAKILHPRGVRTDLRAGDLLTVSTHRRGQHLVPAGLRAADRRRGRRHRDQRGRAARHRRAARPGRPDRHAGRAGRCCSSAAPLITRRVADQQEQAGRATSLATDLVSGLRPLRGIGAAGRRRRALPRGQPPLAARHAARGAHPGRLPGRVHHRSARCWPAASPILAGWFALTGRITVGQFITVIGLAQFLIEPFGILAVVPELDRRGPGVGGPGRAGRSTPDLVLPEGTATPAEHPATCA